MRQLILGLILAAALLAPAGVAVTSAAAATAHAANTAPSGVGCPALFPQGEAAQRIVGGTHAGDYWVLGFRGDVAAIGGARCSGSLAGTLARIDLQGPIVGMAAPLDGSGYWLAGSDGGVFNFGSAQLFGSLGGVHLNQPVIAIAAKPDGSGYWMVATDGGVFSFGGAQFFGSTGNIHLNSPIVGMAATPDGGGYWLVASDGGVFAFGDATFFGSAANTRLISGVVGMAATPDGTGYWLASADGGVFNYGSAPFFGSGTNGPFPGYWVGISPTPDGRGYHLAGVNGVVVGFGDAPFAGSVGIAAACKASQVSVAQPSNGTPLGAAGTIYAGFEITRTAPGPLCSIDGAPPVAALDANSHFVANTASFASFGPSPVYLAPGDVGNFAIYSNEVSPPCNTRTTHFAIALPHDPSVIAVTSGPVPDCSAVNSTPVGSGKIH